MRLRKTVLGLLLAGAFLTSLHADAYGPRRLHTNETQRGRASWYGAEQQGGATASGERFNRHALTAAHRTLPFGSLVRVTNLDNGLTVDVRINDRGPWKGGRVIDVSEAAADHLEMKRAGIVPVKLTVLRLGPPVAGAAPAPKP